VKSSRACTYADGGADTTIQVPVGRGSRTKNMAHDQRHQNRPEIDSGTISWLNGAHLQKPLCIERCVHDVFCWCSSYSLASHQTCRNDAQRVKYLALGARQDISMMVSILKLQLCTVPGTTVRRMVCTRPLSSHVCPVYYRISDVDFIRIRMFYCRLSTS
jgi:hypothetical protein